MKTTAWICDRDKNPILALGIVQSIQDNISASNLTKPIVTYTAEATFTMDISSVESYTIKFTRNNDSDDGNYKSDGKTPIDNATWLSKLRALINQWQADHDGYVLMYDETKNKDYTEKDYVGNHAPIDQVGYIKSLSTTFTCGVPETITGTLTFQSGSMKPNKTMISNSQSDQSDNGIVDERDDVIFYSGLYNKIDATIITMTSSDQGRDFTIFSKEGGDDKSCVSSYTITYGPMDPFPSLSMSISRKRLAKVALPLVDDIVAGCNRITVNACGNGVFIVTKCRTSEQTYTITAYAREEVYKGLQIGQYMSAESRPMTIIRRILNKKLMVGGTSLYYPQQNIVVPYDISGIDNWGTEENVSVLFKPTDTCWYVMSVCAQYMGLMIFFAEDRVFLVPRNQFVAKIDGWSEYINKEFYLNTVDKNFNNEDDDKFSMRVVDNPSIGDEGVDTLENSIGITHTLGTDTTSTGTIYSADYIDPHVIASQRTFGLREGQNYAIPNIQDRSIARTLANRAASVPVDTQLSMTFTVSETRIETMNGEDVNVWRAFFPMVCTVDGLIDNNTDTKISILSSFSIDDKGHRDPLPQKTTLSSITRNFPEFTSTYTFGRISNADLSQTTSKILSAIGNK